MVNYTEKIVYPITFSNGSLGIEMNSIRMKFVWFYYQFKHGDDIC